MDPSDASSIMRVLVDLLKVRKPCALSLRSLTLVLNTHSFGEQAQQWSSTLNISESKRYTEFHALCKHMDDILDDQHGPETTTTSLILNASKALSTRTVNNFTSALQASFPKLHHQGILKIDISIDCMSIGIVMAHACHAVLNFSYAHRFS